MDPQVQASFIPKKPLNTGSSRGAGIGLFFLISLLIFIASVVSAGAAFLYQQYLQKAIADKSHSLDLAQGAYDPGVIQDLMRMDARMTQAQSLLARHTAASAVLSFLATQTLQNVSFGSFGYSLQNDGSAAINLSGQADSFSTVALQSDQFGGNKMLKDVIVSNIAVDAVGRVNFTVTATVIPSVLLYTNTLGQSAGALGTPAPATSTASTTP